MPLLEAQEQPIDFAAIRLEPKRPRNLWCKSFRQADLEADNHREGLS